MRKFIRISAVFLISTIGLIFLAFFLINLPFTEHVVSRKVNNLFTRLELPLHIQNLRTVLPNKVKLEGVTISGPEGDTIICVMDLDARVNLPALLKNKVKLKQLYLGGVLIQLNNDSINTGLNIARAFSVKNKAVPEKPKEKETSWEIDIRQGELQNIIFLMSDPAMGIHLDEEIESLRLSGFILSLLDKSIVFKGIDLNAGHGGLKLSPRLIPPETEKSTPWTFGFNKVQMQDVDFTFNQVADSLLLKLVIQEGLIRTRVTDFSNNEIDADIIKLSGAEATILTGMSEQSPGSSDKQPSQAFPWDIIIDETNLQKVKISMGPYFSPDSTDRSTPPYITLHDMLLVDTRLNEKSAELLVKKLGFDLPNGFSLKQMEGTFASNQESTHLNFDFETENSQSEVEGDAQGGIFEMLANRDQISIASVSLKNTRLSLVDLFYFRDDLKDLPALNTLSKAPLEVEGDFGMDHSMIALSDVSIFQENNFSILLDGSVRDPLHFKKAGGNLTIEIAAKDSTWLKELMKNLDPEANSSALRSFSLNGTFSDTLGNTGIDLILESNLGGLDLSGIIDLENEDFDVNTTFQNIMPGPLLNVESLGAVSGSGAFSGRGFNPDSLSARVSIWLDSLVFNDYQYRHINITAGFLAGLYDINLKVDDPGAKTELFTTVSRSDSTLTLNASATIFAQLDKLHLSEDTVSVESNFRADYRKTPQGLEAEMSLQNIEILSPDSQAHIRELTAVITSDSIESHLKAEADFFTAEISIGEALEQAGTFMEQFQSYLMTFVDSSDVESDTRISKLPTTNISASITYHEALGMVLQDTGIAFSNIDFSLTNSASDQSLNYTLRGKDLKFKGIEIGMLEASAMDSAGIMNFQLLADKNAFFNNPAHRILLNGHYDNWQSDAEFSVIDDEGKIIYNVELASDLDSSMFVLNIPKQQIILNSQIWQVENPRLLSFNNSDKKAYPDLRLHTDSAYIYIYSKEVEGQQLYACELDNVFLESLIRGSLLPGHPSGNISGQFSYGMNEQAERNINTDLQFNNIEWNDVSFGRIALKAFLLTDTAGSYEMDMLARIDSSRIQMEFMQTAGESRSLSTEFSSLPLVVFQPFVTKQLSDMSGNVSGNFDISSAGDGEIEGTLNFNGTSVRVNALNSKYSLPDERIQFSGNRLVFEEFQVLDSLNNTLDINGYIEIDKDWKVLTNLNIGSSGIQVMNTSGDDQASFYGDIFLDSRLSIQGPVKNPVIKGKLLLARGSEIYYRYLEDLSLSESAKYVSFVSSSQDEFQSTHFTATQTKIFDSSIETVLEIDPTTRINFSVSKWAFNIDLGISGGGALNFQMLNNNQYSLSGRYLINEGEANLKLIGWPNKSFRIARGGFIGWDGRIDDPELKFEASNRVASSYTNPVDGKVRNLDIDVFLKLSNHLSDLDIEFSIYTTDQYLMSIINTLSPEEQMRQAITILLFETIDLPGISTSSNYMSQQVNQLVAAQLNSLTKTTISGIDISFGVNTYVQATAGGGEETKTSLSYDVKKTFADDRAQMRVSGRMNDVYNQPGASNFSLSNISLEYQLDSAASRYFKVYNERSYEDVFEGEVVKTGMGITFRKRYWNIKEIWRRKKAKK